MCVVLLVALIAGISALGGDDQVAEPDLAGDVTTSTVDVAAVEQHSRDRHRLAATQRLRASHRRPHRPPTRCPSTRRHRLSMLPRYAVYDATADVWLSAEAADTKRPVGSVIKLLTAYVVMQAGDPTKVVTVPALSMYPEESAIGLYEGEQLQRDTLLRAMLIVSANDAAYALADDVGGSQEQFVVMMNAAAAQLGLTNTSAANASGLDASGSGSTARDMIDLAALLMQDETFRTTVARQDATLHGQTFPATNDLLGAYSGADGVKTGSTTQGGSSIVASATRDGRTIIVAVLGSSTDETRFDAATQLLDWGFSQ